MRTPVAAICCAVMAAGCVSPLPAGFMSGSRKAELEAEATSAQAKEGLGDPQQASLGKSSSSKIASAKIDPNDPRAIALRKAEGGAAPTQDQALADVLDELTAIRAIDPQAEAQLLEELKAVKAEDYPLVVQQFGAALAYRQQVAQREQLESLEQLAKDRRAREAEDINLDPTHPSVRHVPIAHRKPPRPKEVAASPEMLVDVSDAKPQRDSTSPLDAPEVHVLPAPPPDDAQTILAADGPVTTAASAKAPPLKADAGVTPVAYAAAVDDNRSGPWKDRLQGAIAALQQSASPQPGSVEEVHDHMRLRVLQLLAGDRDAAYQPIPGAAAPQQDYWAKQLFAIDAYLDGAKGLDDKQRAAAALVHLDQARAQLSESATLQLRNLTFVDSVDGFGAYKPLSEAKFQPGQKTMIYAEVENFRCRSTAEGFQTTLGTSYQVLDPSGRRVDGAQFSDVVDQCRNRRRDFHMQYDLPLPTQIYPGKYHIELTITDQNSNKIGTAKLPFEIVAQPR